MGSKSRHAKELLPIILKDRKPNQWYVEPFCGGCNMIDKVDGNRMGSDLDIDLITLWQGVSNGWIPPEHFTEIQYKEIRTSHLSPLKGYVAFALSYGGKKWGGWRRDGDGKRNYVTESYKNAMAQFPTLRGVDFRNDSYLDLEIPEDSIIYCDPPYAGTTKYSNGFNHVKFWKWVRERSKTNTVFVSEYNAPDDFDCIWQKEVSSSLTQNTGSKKNIEKLFKYNC
jgi:DNA adenine methylase